MKDITISPTAQIAAVAAIGAAVAAAVAANLPEVQRYLKVRRM
jgi:uncharacterized protein DUF6893